jgi:type I restriction enzyme S subunit
MPTVSDGPWMVTAKDIIGGRIDYSTARKTSLEAFAQRLTPKSRPLINDILLTKDGTIGRVALCDQDGICINQSVALIRANSDAVPAYLKYFLEAPATQDRLEQDSGGSTIKHIYITRIGDVPILLPPKHEQRAIAEVLSALDDKIAANGKTVEQLDLFVSENYRNAAKGGPDRALSSLASFVNGGAYTKGASGTGRVVVRIAELNGGIGGSTVLSDAKVPEEQTARFGDLLFAWSGSLTVRRWFRNDAIINQHIFKVLPKDENSHWLVHQALLSALPSLKAIAADKATTMGHIKREHLDILVRVPDTETTARVSLLLQGAWDFGLSKEQESLRLIALRDALLPALMSGKLRVKDAEQAVEDVL